MGQVLSTVDRCFQPAHLLQQDDTTALPSTKSATKAAPAKAPAQPVQVEKKAPVAAPVTAPTPAPVEAPVEAPAPKKEEPKAEVATKSSGGAIPYTNRPEDLEGFPKASGAFVPKAWTIGQVPDCSKPLTGEYVTDGKVSFDKAALSYEGVFSSRDEEVAQLQKAIDLKKNAGAETAKANTLHQEHNDLFAAGDKDGAREKLAESKIYREKAQQIHEESLNLAYAGAMSMAIKAVYSKYPSIDYHVFLVDPYEKSYLVAIDLFKKYAKYPRTDYLIIPGEGQHSDKSGPKIRPHFEQWMTDNKINNEQVTSGSYAITLADVKP